MMRTFIGIAGTVGLLLALCATAGADDADCGTLANPFVVDDGPAGPKAQRVAGGFDCDSIDLQIVSDLNITVVTLRIEARSVLIKSNTPGQRVQMVNDQPSSVIFILAGVGDITISGASIKAHKVLWFQCDGTVPLCKFTAEGSDLIAAADFQNLGAGGDLNLVIRGPINIQGTNVHGGDTLEVQSINSSITLICAGTPGTCKDPIAPPIAAIIAATCGNPPTFPCLVDFPDAASLSSVCIEAPFVRCNGGHKEKRFTAATDIDITGSTIVSDEHVTFSCRGADPGSGLFKGRGATLDMDSVRIDCKGKVDIANAKITTATDTTILSGVNCPGNTVCIDASGAQITARPQRLTAGATGIIDACGGTFTTPGTTGFAILNNDTTPPYTRVLDTAVECAPRAPGTFCNDNGCFQN